MPRRPGDTEREPQGGCAAERLHEFLNQRFPGGLSSAGRGKEALDRRDEQDNEREGDDPAERQKR